MRRLLICLIPWMASTAAWTQDSRPVSVVYTYLGASSDGPLRVGDECFIPPELASRWGWTVHLKGGEANVEAEGRHIRIYAREIDGKKMIPVISACYQLGADAQWSPQGDSLRVLGVIRNVEFAEGGIRVDSTLAVRPKKTVLNNPERVVIDFQGAKLWRGATESIPGGIRLKQFGSDAVRLVVEKKGAAKLSTAVLDPTRSYSMRLEPEALPAPTYEPLPTVGPPITGIQEPTAPAVTVNPIQFAGAPTIAKQSDTELNLVFPLSQALTTRPSGSYSSPTTIEILLPSVKAPEGQPKLEESEFIGNIEILDDGRGSTRLVIETKLALGFLLTQEGRAIKVKLLKPKSSNGKLAGKIIVIDAGHGGPDGGTQWSNPPVSEKDLTLKIARQTARLLSAEGAAVIMTRNDDTKIPLTERPAIATRSKADVFISIHINSNQLNNSRSGTITFFHNQNPICILLATCIQSEIVKVSGLPGLGTWSDTRIYKSGFSVLRNATVPAVLIECGFLNHKTDRERMMSAEFQSQAAAAIVKGLKVFVGEAQVKSP